MTLVPHLAALEASGLIRLAAVQPELEYLFRHTLVQEAAYTSLVKADRKRLHLAVGEALERLYPDRAASRELAPILGAHFDQAGDDERALKYFTLAGDEAAKVYANTEAIAHYTRALEIAQRATHPEGPRSAAEGVEGASHVRRLYTRRGRVLELNSQYDEALANYAEMETLADERDDRALKLAALMARATLHAAPTSKFDPAQARRLCEQALALARTLGDRQAEAKILGTLMLHSKFTGQLREALDYSEQALDIARELGEGGREQVAYTLNDISNLYMANGQLARAFAALEEARALWRALDNQPMLVDSLCGTASLLVLTGEHERALPLYEEAQAISERIGNVWGQSYSRYMLDFVYAERGEMKRAIEVAEECIRLGEQAGFVVPRVQIRTQLAMGYDYLGDTARALALAREACAAAEQLLPSWRSLPLIIVALVHLHIGDLAAAETALHEAQSGLDPDTVTSPAPFFFVLAGSELALARRDYAQTLALADDALTGFLRRFGLRLFLTDILYLKSQAQLGLSQPEAAYTTLREARTEAEALTSRRTLWRILHALSALEAARGNIAEAQTLRQQAREIVLFIADHCPPGLRMSFLNLSQVRRVLDAQD